MAFAAATLVPGAGYTNVTLTSWTGDAAFATAPVAGGQIEHPDTISVSNAGVVTGAVGTYTLLYISPTGDAQAIQHPIVEPSSESATATGTLSAGADYTTATLASNFNAATSAFQQWTGGNPAAGWQIETLTAEGWFDSQGQYWKAPGVADGIQDVWVIQLNGTVTVEQFDNTGLATFGATQAPQGTWAIGPVTKTETTASLTPIYSLGDASSFERTLNGTDWIAFEGTISLTGLTEGTNYPDAAVRAVNSVGPGTSASFAFTTESEVVVTPDTSTIAMFLDNIPDGTHKTVILDSVNDVVLFSGNLVWTGEARSYVLDLVPGSIVVYYVIGATEGGLQRGVTA